MLSKKNEETILKPLVEPIDCSEIVPYLHAHHDGELAAADELIIKRHAIQCAQCLAVLNDINDIAEKLHSLSPVQADRDFADGIANIIAGRGHCKRSQAKKDTSATGKHIEMLTVQRRAVGLKPAPPAFNFLAAAAAVLLLVVFGTSLRHSKVAGLVAMKSNNHRQFHRLSDKDGLIARLSSAASTSFDKQEKNKSKELTCARPDTTQQDDSFKHDLIAYDGSESSISEELGITIDKDGLYAIKLEEPDRK